MAEASLVLRLPRCSAGIGLLIGSMKDNKSIILEKSPSKFGIYETQRNYLVCANHFQSDAFSKDDANKQQILESLKEQLKHHHPDLSTEEIEKRVL